MGSWPRAVGSPILGAVDIRTKLVFAIVLATLGSMFALGVFTYMTANRLLSDSAADQLESLAESGEGALESIAEGWRERVQLIASRTQLRISLREHVRSRDPEATEQIRRILRDARTSVRSVAALAVFELDGELVARSDTEIDPAPTSLPAPSLAAPSDEVRFLGVSFVPDDVPRLAVTTGLALDEEKIGVLYVLLKAHRLADLTGDYTGLGETGEFLIVARDGDGVRTLHPVRHEFEAHDDGRGWIRLPADDHLAERALIGDAEGALRGGVTDYRGREVWASTRRLDGPGWGLIVKFDAAEKRTDIVRFREEMIAVALSLGGLAILVAVVLGFRFAGPIHKLAEATDRVREGDFSTRVEVTREDEIGLLARTFNKMADTLEDQVEELHEFHKFFDVSLDMMCVAGTDGYFKVVNPAFTTTLGWSEEELTDRPFFDLVHPEDLAATQHEIEKLSRGIPTISFVNRFRCKDGTWKRLRWNSYPEADTGRLYAIARETNNPLTR